VPYGAGRDEILEQIGELLRVDEILRHLAATRLSRIY
jgi:hypothetical protein